MNEATRGDLLTDVALAIFSTRQLCRQLKCHRRRRRREQIRERGREEMKFSVKGGIFNTWPHSGEGAGRRCGSLHRPLHRWCSFEKITWSLVGIRGLLSAVISTPSRSDYELITPILISLLSNSPPPRLLNLSPPVLLYSFLFPMLPQLESKNYKLTAHLRRTSGYFIILSNVRRNSWALLKI